MKLEEKKEHIAHKMNAKALNNAQKLENKKAGKEIGSLISWRRKMMGDSFPFHSVKSLEKKYPKQTEAYGKKTGPSGKYFK